MKEILFIEGTKVVASNKITENIVYNESGFPSVWDNPPVLAKELVTILEKEIDEIDFGCPEPWIESQQIRYLFLDRLMDTCEEYPNSTIAIREEVKS